MSYYDYKAIDYSGQTIKGTLNAGSEDTASANLKNMGLYIISIRERDHRAEGVSRILRQFLIGKADIVDFAQSFSVMLNAGIPLLASLEDIIASTKNDSFRTVLEEIKQMLESGSSLSAALEAQGKIFPEILRTLVAVGEVTGKIDESLREAAEHLQKMQNLANSIKRALMYPAFAFAATIGAMAFWFAFVIPQLTSTLKGMGVKLPALTILLINSSNFFSGHWKLLIVWALAAAAVMYALMRIHKVRHFVHLAFLKLPVIKMVAENKLLATFSEQFRILLAAGIGMEKLFQLLIPSVGNVFFSDRLEKAKADIMTGKTISEALKQQDILPALALSKVSVGETTGTLDKQFAFLSGYYSKKLDEATENMGKIIEPLVMAVIGALFAVIIMGLLLPIYDLVSKLGKS